MSIFQSYDVLMDTSLPTDTRSTEDLSSTDAASTRCRYRRPCPSFSSQDSLRVYEKEEAFEHPAPTWQGSEWLADSIIQPTVYHLLRLFDSVKGFHRVSIVDLSTPLSCTLIAFGRDTSTCQAVILRSVQIPVVSQFVKLTFGDVIEVLCSSKSMERVSLRLPRPSNGPQAIL